jgi:hypothetical protein
MRPKARGLAQHGGPLCFAAWLEERSPAGLILYVMDGPYRLPFAHRTGAAQLQAEGTSCITASGSNCHQLLAA